MTDESQKAFEQWFRTETSFSLKKSADGEYENLTTHWAAQAAGWATEREREACAKIAYDDSNEIQPGEEMLDGNALDAATAAGIRIEEAIRARGQKEGA